MTLSLSGASMIHPHWSPGKHANINRKPVVFDPVGVGASQYRRSSANCAHRTMDSLSTSADSQA